MNAKTVVNRVVYRYSEDDAAMFGPDPDNVQGVDVQASYQEYRRRVRRALEARWPDADVVVEAGPDRMAVDGMTDTSEAVEVGEIVHSVWSSFEWLSE